MPEDYGDWSSSEKMLKYRRKIKNREQWIICDNVLLVVTGWVDKDKFGHPAYVVKILTNGIITSDGLAPVGSKVSLPIKWFNVGKHNLRRLETPFLLT